VSHIPFQSERCASNWFYSLPTHSLHNFEEVSEAFLFQYVSRRETKRNNHHLLTIKIRQSDSLKSYIVYSQSQLAKVSNCSEDVTTLAFISGLQVSHSLYKPEAQCHSDERGFILSSTLHPIVGGNEDFLQPLREA